jgi:hypothetical protein
MMIYIGMIVLDNFLQYLIYIVMIDLSSACCFTYKSLVMLMSYLWLKIKLKVLIYVT